MRRLLAVGILVVAALPATALATTFRGAAVDDSELSVHVRVTKGGVVSLDYANVLVNCTNGDDLREPGAEHSAMLADDRSFRDEIDQDLEDGATGHSFVRGRVGKHKAKGVLDYDLVYDGGECDSGKLRWKAHRKKAPQQRRTSASLRSASKKLTHAG